jgi:hypothetical protein
MKKAITCSMTGGLILLFVWSNLILAQITLKAKDAPSVPGVSFVMSYAETVVVNLGEPGENKYWDFSNIPLPQEDYWRVVDFNKSPFAYKFPTGNLAYQVTENVQDTTFITYNYARLTDSELSQLGRGVYEVVGTDTTIQMVVAAKRTKPQLNLPVSYGDPEWSSIFELDTLFLGFEATVKDSNYNRVDAWGTIKTVFGEFPCLRIRQDHSIFARAKLLPSLKFAVEINIIYYWVTYDYGIIATVTGMSDVNNPNPDPNFSIARSVNIMTSFTPSAVEISSGEIPRVFDLLQNYPNPFNPQTTIRYQLNEAAEVKLRVFNIAGQEVALLVRARQNPGNYEVEWNAGNLPSGVYYYQINANQNLVTKKCLLLK